MKVKEFLSVFKDPYVLFPLYLTKSIILPQGMVDFWILGVICFMALAEKFLTKANSQVDRFFDAKEKVLTENQFRSQVNADMSKIVEEINVLKIQSMKPNLLGTRK